MLPSNSSSMMWSQLQTTFEQLSSLENPTAIDRPPSASCDLVAPKRSKTGKLLLGPHHHLVVTEAFVSVIIKKVPEHEHYKGGQRATDAIVGSAWNTFSSHN
uniref:Uncharacterized protein n=1 Tax=Sphaerodactylus townsendi TaxID=933632 RepID=A0ACB8ECJ5_9SAUR